MKKNNFRKVDININDFQLWFDKNEMVGYQHFATHIYCGRVATWKQESQREVLDELYRLGSKCGEGIEGIGCESRKIMEKEND